MCVCVSVSLEAGQRDRRPQIAVVERKVGCPAYRDKAGQTGTAQNGLRTGRMPPMIEIKTRLQPADLALVDRQAAALGITRSELIRRRVTGCNDGGSGFTPADYHRLVVDASRFMRGAIDRTQVETLVAYVIRRLDSHLTASIARHQPPA
jgi:hypothetical protein